WSTVAPATRSGVQVRNGPPDAVRMSRASSPARRPAMHCSTALCSESTGTIPPPPSRAIRVTSSPAITSVSLLASATRFPARSAARGAPRPAAPPMASTPVPHTRRDRGDEVHRIEAIEHAAVPRDEGRGILDADLALEQRLGDVSDLRCYRHHQSHRHQLPGAKPQGYAVEHQRTVYQRRDQAADD